MNNISGHSQNPVFRLAEPGEGKKAFELIEERVAWFEKRGLDQWPREHYLSVYNRDYFEQAVRLRQLWVLAFEGEIRACGVLLEQDERWNGDSTPAWYIHNLASRPGCSGAGALFLQLAEEEARHRHKRYLRLDCRTGAKKLNAYYKSKGYCFAGYWKQPQYRGNLRQKFLEREKKLCA